RRIRSGKAGDVPGDRVRHPDAVLLIDGEVERSHERLARLDVPTLAHDPAFRVVATREEQQLIFRYAERPDIPPRSYDDPWHQAGAAAEGDALRRCQWLAVLVEHRDRLAAVAGKPRVVLRIDCCTEGAALHAAAGKASRNGREWLSIGIELSGVALPQL